MPPLIENPVISTLRSRISADTIAAGLYGALQPIIRDITPLLEFIRHSFPGYPSHGIDHSFRILQRIGGILRPEALASLSSYELFTLILAVLFHDSGMVAPESNMPNDPTIRQAHHQRSAQLVQRYLAERLPLHSSLRLRRVAAFVIEAHGMTWEDMQRHADFGHAETIDGELLRPAILAVLLRIGDLMDLDNDRTSDLCLTHCSAWYSNVESRNHNERHQHVKHFRYDSKRLVVHVTCPTRAQYKIWFSWLEYLRQDIERANTYLFIDDLSSFHLPTPDLLCEPSSNATFELWPLRFELDDSGALWDVISRSVYTGRLDYVRELLQNGIDACLRHVYEDPNATMGSTSPRTWTTTGYRAAVRIIVSRRRARLVVVDNGVGMDRDTVSQFLFRVAASGMKRQVSFREWRFPAIATFGIGFVSVLTRAQRVSLVTRQHAAAPEDGLRIQLDTGLRDAIVERAPDAPGGTTVSLAAVDARYLDEVPAYIEALFRYPCVSLHVLDLDILEESMARARSEALDVPLPSDEFLSECIVGDARHSDALFGQVQAFERSLLVEREKSPEAARAISPLNVPKKPVPYSSALRSCPARAPRRLPLKLARYFEIGMEAVLEKPTLVGATGLRRGRRLGRGLLLVPVQFDDHAIGVEWRSLHAFLLIRGAVTKRLGLFRSTASGKRELAVGDDGGDLGDAAAWDLDEWQESDEAVDRDVGNPYDLIDHFSKFQRREENSYLGPAGIAIVAERRDIAVADDVDLEDLDSLVIRPTDQQHSLRRQYDWSSYFDVKRDFDIREDVEAYRALDLYLDSDRDTFQDGIRLPLEISSIAPVGTVAGAVNLLAGARLSYNVARNAIDQSEDRLAAWRSTIGGTILKRVAAAVCTALDRVGVSYSAADLWTGDRACIPAEDDWRSILREFSHSGRSRHR